MSAVVLQEMPLDTQAVNSECKGFIFTTAREKARLKCWSETAIMGEGIITGGTKKEKERRGWQRERGGRQNDGEREEKKRVKQWFLTAAIPPLTPSPHQPYPPQESVHSSLCWSSLPPSCSCSSSSACFFIFFFASCEHVDATLPLCVSLSRALSLSLSPCQSVCAFMWQVRDMYRGIRKCDCIERHV